MLPSFNILRDFIIITIIFSRYISFFHLFGNIS